MILAASGGVDYIGVLGLLLALGIVAIPLLIFAIKALIYKTVAPIRDRQNQQENKMQVLEREVEAVKHTNENIMRELKDLPDKIIAGLREREKVREEIYDLKYQHKK